MLRKHIAPIVVLVLLVLIVILGAFFLGQDKQENQFAPSSKLRIEGFNSKGVCAALMPACGYCPGEEVDDNCYVTQSEFDEYKKHDSELKASK